MDKLIQQRPTGGSLARAELLISAIARGSRRGSALTELVAKTGLPRPTIHRVLNQLIRMGWVERDVHTARFNLGPALAALGYSAVARHSLERIAAPYLSQLALDIGRIVYLNIRDGLDMVCIGRYESGIRDENEKGVVGMRGPLGMSPGCMAIFAKLPQEEVEGIIAANLSRYHRIQGFDERAFRKSLVDTTKRGYGSYEHILLDRALSALAVAVVDEAGYPVAAISTTYYGTQIEKSDADILLHALQRAASDIQQQISTSAI